MKAIQLKNEVEQRLKEAIQTLNTKIEIAKDEIKEVSQKMHTDNIGMRSDVEAKVNEINERVKEFSQVATDVRIRFETDCVAFF